MEIILKSDIINYREKTPIDRFSAKKNWAVFCKVELSENNLYKPQEGDTIYDDLFKRCYMVFKVINEKILLLVPWGIDDAVDIIPDLPYFVVPKRTN